MNRLLLTSLAVLLVAAPFSLLSSSNSLCSSAPCAAKEKYDNLVKLEAVHAKKVIAATPAGSTPAGNVTDWQATLTKLKADPTFNLTQSKIDAALSSKRKTVNEKLDDIETLQYKAFDLLVSINKIKSDIKEATVPNPNAEQRKKLAELNANLRESERRLESQSDLIHYQLNLVDKLKGEIAVLKNIPEARKIAASLTAWIAYSKVHDEWSAVDDQLTIAKEDYDKGVKEKNRAVNNARELMAQEQAQIQSVADSFLGKPHDNEYVNATRAVITHAISAMQSIERSLTGLECFDDAKAMLADAKGRRERLQAMKMPVAEEDRNSSVIGTWNWYFSESGPPTARGTVTFSRGNSEYSGTMSWSGGNSGTWKQTASSVALKWEGSETTDTMTVGADGKTMTGTNSKGWQVKGTRQ